MTSLAFIECCQRLSVNPKTLRQWLAQAEMSLHPHPTDARTKCLTSEQLQILAALHGRVLQMSGVPLPSAGSKPDEGTDAVVAVSSATDLQARLVLVEAQVVTLQSQLTDLALQLLKERQQRTEQRLRVLEAHRLLISDPHATRSVAFEQTMPVSSRQAPRQRKSLIPLIEYGACDRYVLMSPNVGEMEIMPDTSEWVAWLATLTSFRFIGQQGRFSTYRNKGRTYWTAYRRIHGHVYSYTLGRTEYLTIDRLEQMAQTLQAHVPSF